MSDHDSTVNHAPLQPIADRRDVPFIASMELSPSWGHFNAWPLQPGMKLAIDTQHRDDRPGVRRGAPARGDGRATQPPVHSVWISCESCRRRRARWLQSRRSTSLEINSDEPERTTRKVLHDALEVLERRPPLLPVRRAPTFTTSGTTCRAMCGCLRTSKVRPRRAALRRPSRPVTRYVSLRSVDLPGVMFGSDLKVKPGATFTLAVRARNPCAGLKQATLIGTGAVAAHKAFAGAPQKTRVEFPLTAGQVDAGIRSRSRTVAGHKAYSDPIWIDVVDSPARPALAATLSASRRPDVRQQPL